MASYETGAQRAAFFIAGVLIWILHSFVRLALWPLSMLGYVYFAAAALLLMGVVTYLCTYYLLVVSEGNRFALALKLMLLWLLIYAVAEYGRNYYLTQAFDFPVEKLPRLLLEVTFIPLGCLACGALMHIASRRADKSSRHVIWR